MKKLISIGLSLYILKLMLLSITGIYIPDIVVWCIIGYAFIHDAGMMKEAKKVTDDFKKGFNEAS